MNAKFIHLQCYTEYSIKFGILRIKEWLQELAALEMPAVAITDQANLCGLVKFYKQAIALGIKPIIGSKIWVENPADPARPYQLTLLCKNQTGYKNLTKVLSKSYLQRSKNGNGLELPIAASAWLAEYNVGLLAIAPAVTSDVAVELLAGKSALAVERIAYWQRLYPQSFYLAVTRIGQLQEEEYLQKIVPLSVSCGCPLVASNEVCFLRAADFEAHEARVCINEGSMLGEHIAQQDQRNQKYPKNHTYTTQQYLKSPQEMCELFADLPTALENSVEIAQRCNLQLQLGQVFLPKYPLPPQLSAEQYLRQQSQQGLQARLDFKQQHHAEQDPAWQQKYWNRLELELAVIVNMGFAGYFLIVADFINWAQQQDIPVGPGRGSGAGSLVAYALKITNLDPLDYDLLFERFLNPERVSMPDFDIDFCMEGRDRVIDYVTNKYGRNSVAQIITFGTMAAKAVVRDVGRVLAYPYGFVDKIAKLIPFELGMTLDKALQQEQALAERYANEEDVKTLIDLAQKLEGVTRNIGKHAGGVVIAASQLTDYLPLYCEAGEDHIITQLDKNDVEEIGLIKFDFLGLRTLTIIHGAMQTINASLPAEQQLNIDLIPLDDPKTFQMLCNAATTAVFQLESRGMKDLIARLEPDCLEDIIALVALFRPGPLQSGMVDDFINRKKGLAPVEYPHPTLAPILRPTYGIILYQEQVMQIAQVLAGYSLGAADLLRRAMGKKKLEEMAKQREIFVQGAIANKVAPDNAAYIFDLMEKFAGYGFNKSHSVAYGLVSYQTAWLKAHYPAAFMSAVLSADLANTDKIVLLIEECRALGLIVEPPSVNSSAYKFTIAAPSADGTEVRHVKRIIYGLGAIKGVGESVINTIITARASGAFRDIYDLCARVDGRKVTRRVLEALIYAGALDCFGGERAQLMAELPLALTAAEQRQKDLQVGQFDLFGNTELQAQHPTSRSKLAVKPWSNFVRLQGEKDTLGFYLTGHPINEYAEELRLMQITKLADLSLHDQAPGNNAVNFVESATGNIAGNQRHFNSKFNQRKLYRVAGFIVNLRTLITKRGDRMAFIIIDDRSARIEVVIFADLFATCAELLQKDSLVIIEAEISQDQYSGGIKLIGKQVMDLYGARSNYASSIKLQIAAEQAGDNLVESIYQFLAVQPKGKCPVVINYQTATDLVRLRLGANWLLRPSAELLTGLVNLHKDIVVRYEYN